MDDTRRFVHLRLRGGRFDQAEGMPVAALAELLAFRDLVTATARVLFKQDHPRRVRVPRRFDERLDLRLVRVEAGSAVPVLERRGDTGELPLPDEFDRARDLVIESIDAVVRDGALRDLPDEQLGTLFARVGQTLEGDESIEIGRPGAQPRVCYDRAARRRALLARTDTYVEMGSLTGTAVSLDRERLAFQFRVSDNVVVPGSCDSVGFYWVKEVLEIETPPVVHVTGLIRFDRVGRALRIEQLASLTDAPDDALSEPSGEPADQDESVIVRRLRKLADLEPGWHEGVGEKISATALRVAREIALSTADAGFAPRLYPTVEGGVSAEWSLPSREVSVEIGPAGSLYVHDLEVDTETTREFEIEESARASRLVLEALGSPR